MYKKLVLFDIDKTLIDNSRAHYFAFSKAIYETYKINTSINLINHFGMTDQEIIIKLLKKHGLKTYEIKKKLKKCLKFMVKYFNEMINSEKIVVLEGVKEILEEMIKRRNILLGLVTGNLKEIAKGKLKKANLDKYFKIGSFGNDDLDRANLINIAIKRAEDLFNFNSKNKVFYIGDSIKDIIAGKKAKVITIGIATGIYSEKELKKAGADFVFKNLRDTKNILKVILYK